MLSLVSVAAFPALGNAPATGPNTTDQSRDVVVNEDGDETQSWKNARELESGDAYYGHVDRVTDRSDHFKVTVAQHQVVNAHIYLMGHDGVNEWVRPPTTDPPSPPAPPRTSAMLDCFIYHDPGTQYPLDGAFNYYYVRDYMLNIVAPIPGTNVYHINVTINWAWTPNNYTWDYKLELEVGSVPEISAGSSVLGTLDMAGRDTHWYKVQASDEQEVNGSFEILNFDTANPEDRNVDVWVFPDDLGGYPRSISWDWSAAPNEPVEPFSILSTYDGHYYIKLRGMNHEAALPCNYRLEVNVHEIPVFPDTGIQNNYFDRHWHDTDWYKFDMSANQPHNTKPGDWNDVQYFNMTERADAEELPDFDLYLFGRAPGTRVLDLLDSSFRNDHSSFQDPDRDPNRNTEHVSGAAYYTGTYYLEVNAWNNTGYYDVRKEFKPAKLSDGNNLPEEAESIGPGIYGGYIHQAWDHYDWYSVRMNQSLEVTFDSYKAFDMFNLSVYKYDMREDTYRLIASKWNVRFNLTSRSDEVTHDITVKVDATAPGMSAGTYYIAVYAAVATSIGTDPVSGRPFVYATDGSAVANYDLRMVVDGLYLPEIITEPIPPDTVEEDTNLLDHIDLREHFIPSDPSFSLHFTPRLVSGKGQVIHSETSLGFKAAPDYNGKVVVKVTASAANVLPESLYWEITFTSMNDAPRTDIKELPLVFTLPEDSIRMLDLGSKVFDVDQDDVLTVSYDAPEHLDLEMEADTWVITALGHSDWFGEETVVFTVTDLDGAILEIPIQFVVENVDDAPILLKELVAPVIMEDSSFSLDLYEYIADPDGDPLTVSISEDPYIGYKWDVETGLLTLAPLPDWYGGRLLWISATDPSGRSLQVSMWFEVVGVPDGPVITSSTPLADQVGLLEEDAMTFVVLEVEDADSSVLFYRWFVDGDFVGPSVSFSYHPGIHDQGIHEVTVVVEDEEGLTDTRVWIVDVEDVPHAPNGGIATPPDGAQFREDEPVPFVAFYYDPDGSDLSYQWFVDGELVSDESVFEHKMEAGDHQVTLQVTSDGDSVTEELEVTVVEVTSGVSMGAVVALVVLAIVAVVAVLFIIARRRS
jgi:hypothetical protein